MVQMILKRASAYGMVKSCPFVFFPGEYYQKKRNKIIQNSRYFDPPGTIADSSTVIIHGEFRPELSLRTTGGKRAGALGRMRILSGMMWEGRYVNGR
jgi:hypothetical protein